VNLFCARSATGCGLIALATFGGLLVGCASEPPDRSDVVRPVRTMVVAAGESSRVRSFPGTVEASRRVELAFQVPGLLVQLPVKEGQRVAEGELIGQIRQEEFQARLGSLEGQLDRARAALAALRAGERREEQLRREAQVRQAAARLANAKAELDRATRLVQSRTIPRADFELTETAYRVAVEDHQSALQMAEKGTVGREEDILAAEAEVRGLEGRVVEANLQLQDTTLTAPYDGVIAERFVEQGQNVRAKQPIVRFQDVDEIEIVVDVPESVMAADLARADIEDLRAELSGAPGIEFPARIREIGQMADPTTRTFKVRAAAKAPEGVRALPGMTATLTMTYQRASVLGESIRVPVSAVSQRDRGEQIVWVVDAEGRVAARPVKVGTITGGEIEITEGLAPGDRIAVAGVSFLREGMTVRDLGDALGGGAS
jgi:multidrug efflux system membrane fusion protein